MGGVVQVVRAQQSGFVNQVSCRVEGFEGEQWFRVYGGMVVCMGCCVVID